MSEMEQASLEALEELERQIHFMVLEVAKQVEDASRVLCEHDPATIEKVNARDDHIDNFKSVIENTCFSRLLDQSRLDKKEMDFTRAVNIIGSNLERISDYSVRAVQRAQFLSSHDLLRRFDHRPLFDEVREGLEIVVPALFEQDLSRALALCRAESALDVLYKAVYAEIVELLRSGDDTNDLITALFIFRYLERMGDALLNIGEAVIFSVVGEKLKINQYQALRRSLDDLGVDASLRDVDFEGIWGTRSGCRIGKVSDAGTSSDQLLEAILESSDRTSPGTTGADGGSERRARPTTFDPPVAPRTRALRERSDESGSSRWLLIFKEGKLPKILCERLGIESWAGVSPGLVPRVLGFHEGRENASILLEYIRGLTYHEILEGGDGELIEAALSCICETAPELWRKTKRAGRIGIRNMEQLFSRMDDVLAAHPALDRPGASRALERLRELETGISAPFSVFVHGDFNTNNIIYDREEARLHYIDVHRSRRDDYAQDVSVFLVSNFRFPVVEESVRRNLDLASSRFLEASRSFAARNGDEAFELRLALGLVRSFVTSTRFELDEDFAGKMFDRGIRLAESILDHGDRPFRELEVPVAVCLKGASLREGKREPCSA